MLNSNPQPVIPTQLSSPNQKVKKRGNHPWIWFFALAFLLIIFCIGGFIVFGKSLISSQANLKPTETNVPVVIDVPSLLGRSVDEIRALYKVDESSPLQLIEPDSFSPIPSGSFMESYFFQKYNIDIFYDTSLHVIAFDVFSGLVEDRIPITEWQIALKMFNINVTSLPDFCSKKGPAIGSCSSIDMSYLVLRWSNFDGHEITILSEPSNNFVRNIYFKPAQIP